MSEHEKIQAALDAYNRGDKRATLDILEGRQRRVDGMTDGIEIEILVAVDMLRYELGESKTPPGDVPVCTSLKLALRWVRRGVEACFYAAILAFCARPHTKTSHRSVALGRATWEVPVRGVSGWDHRQLTPIQSSLPTIDTLRVRKFPRRKRT
jgi:hypothetical protein